MGLPAGEAEEEHLWDSSSDALGHFHYAFLVSGGLSDKGHVLPGLGCGFHQTGFLRVHRFCPALSWHLSVYYDENYPLERMGHGPGQQKGPCPEHPPLDAADSLACQLTGGFGSLRTDLDYGDAEQLIAGLSGQTQRLTGIWTIARRNERSEIETTTYTFGTDGTVTLSPCVYLNGAYEPDLAEGEQGWFVAPMGHPSTYGTYTFDGKSVVMEFLSDDVTGSDEWINWTEVYTVGGDLESALELDGERYVLEKAAMDMESLWDVTGVDSSVY